MFHEDLYSAERKMQMRVAEELRQAEGRRLARLARPDVEECTAGRVRELLGRLGGLMVAAGRKIEELASSRSVPLGSETASR
jgi:hypothetical protein